jgi:hypothetical protein
MNGFRRKFFAYQTLCRALPIVLGIAIILASVFPTSAMHVEHFANDYAQVIAMSDHAIPADKKVQDHKTHATCSPGAGCFAFTVPAEETSALTPFRAVIECFDTVQLMTRIVAPPLPPPKIIILV